MNRSPDPAVLDIRIGRVEQLFQTFDPSPFRDRDLDPKATQYIVDWARGLNRKVAIGIHLHVQAKAGAAEDVRSAVRGYFEHRADAAVREMRELFRLGRIYLVIGLLILVLSLVGSELAVNLFGESPSVSIIAESLVILGWVANWRPLETFLYEWWPLRRDIVLFRRLAAAQVEVSVAS
ncbi:MAG: hypothetical protein LJE69_15310 [Thiohalocapsa sp.]|jgi:hypothetical protein|uniref:hypothetical protein n=1 Tax=Thiohalocapsa sp. TaxID=2497641 RepID=UPI0025F63E6D|nr:hypothetical protein [Thiohalocapsa sp.]MCG6942607.1 hypothetical protein [Thiohalocapsa sp.]